MPAMRCTRNGREGWKWGERGHCHTGPNARAVVAFIAQQSGEHGRSDALDRLLQTMAVPSGLRRLHGALCLRRLRHLHEALREALPASEPGTVVSDLQTVGHLWQLARPLPRRSLRLLAERVERQTTLRAARAVGRVTGSPRALPRHHADALLSGWVEQTASRLRESEAAALQAATGLAERALSAGASPEQAAALLRRQAQQHRQETVALAGDLLSTLHARVVRATLSALGARTATWVACDEACCGCDHTALSGQPFDVASGHPEHGFPGAGEGCGCLALPVGM